MALAVAKLDGLTTRRGLVTDYAVFVELFREIAPDDPAPDPDRWEQTLARESLMVEHQGQVIAFAHTELFPDRAHVHLVAVLPAYRRRSVGQFLMQALKNELCAGKIPRFFLHVREKNRPAIRLYESIGMSKGGGSTGMRIAWAHLHELEHGPDSLRTGLVLPERDAEVERVFAMPPTRLSRARACGQIVLGLFSGAGVVGIAIHDPGLPATTPFRVKRPEQAPRLLLGLEAYAEPGCDFVAFAVNDDPEAEELLTALGASELYRSYRYEGVP